MRERFDNREQAGLLLAEQLKQMKLREPLVLAIPRGGVAVAYHVAKALNAELDIITPRKLCAPLQPELAIGAVMPDNTVFLSKELAVLSGADQRYIGEEQATQRAEAIRRLRVYRADRPYPAIKGRVVILVDDGIATGATVIVALRWIRKSGARETILAVPVAPREQLREIEREADIVVCIEKPELFFALGQFYKDFAQMTDQEVIRLLKSYWHRQL